MSRSTRRTPPLLLLALPLLLCGCFEQPVIERLLLRFLPDGGVEVTASVEIHESAMRSETLTRRLLQVERAVLSGEDPWPQRFLELQPARESFQWDKEKGRLVRAERRAVSDDPGRLEGFFSDTPILAQYQTGSSEDGTGWASLGLYPGPGGRADRRQTRRVTDALDDWSEALAPYLEATEDLYRYLEIHPERAEPCLTELYGGLLEHAEEPELLAEEEERLERLEKSLETVTEVLEIDSDEGYSLDELSHLVYDPFPARVTVEVPGPVLETEGFVPAARADIPTGAGAGSRTTELSIPGLGFWEAWTALEGVWIFPDPAASSYRLALSEDPDGDFARLLAAERRTEPAPQPKEIRAAVENLLRPEPAYRVVWATAGGR